MLQNSPSGLSIYVKIALCAFLPGFIFSCTESRQESVIPVINIEEGIQQGQVVRLSDLCASIEYIPLQTDSSSLLGGVQFIQTPGECIYCADRNSSNCKIFDKQGNFLRNIGHRGKGKGEFLYLSGLMAENDRPPAITDFRKIIIYDNIDLPVKEIPLDPLTTDGSRVTDVINTGNNSYGVSLYHFKDETKTFCIINDTGKVLFRYEAPQTKKAAVLNAEIDGEIIAMKAITPLHIYPYRDNVRMIIPDNDTLFSFSREFEKTPLFIFHLGKYKLKEDNSNKNASVKVIPGSLQESNSHLFFTFVFPAEKLSYGNPANRLGYAFYEKQSGKVKAIAYDPVSRTTGLQNDIDNGMPFWPTAIIGDKMYQIIDAIHFIQQSERSRSAKMKEIAAGLTENSNPVIIAATLSR